MKLICGGLSHHFIKKLEVIFFKTNSVIAKIYKHKPTQIETDENNLIIWSLNASEDKDSLSRRWDFLPLTCKLIVSQHALQEINVVCWLNWPPILRTRLKPLVLLTNWSIVPNPFNFRLPLINFSNKIIMFNKKIIIFRKTKLYGLIHSYH